MYTRTDWGPDPRQDLAPNLCGAGMLPQSYTRRGVSVRANSVGERNHPDSPLIKRKYIP